MNKNTINTYEAFLCYGKAKKFSLIGVSFSEFLAGKSVQRNALIANA